MRCLVAVVGHSWKNYAELESYARIVAGDRRYLDGRESREEDKEVENRSIYEGVHEVEQHTKRGSVRGEGRGYVGWLAREHVQGTGKRGDCVGTETADGTKRGVGCQKGGKKTSSVGKSSTGWGKREVQRLDKPETRKGNSVAGRLWRQSELEKDRWSSKGVL